MYKIIMTLVLCIVLAGTTGCGNAYNSIPDSIQDGVNSAIQMFNDTGIRVKTPSERIFYVYEDQFGWLYYVASGEGNALCPVVDENGNRTKDKSIFDQEDQ